MKQTLFLLLIATLAAPVSAQSFMDKVKTGAGKVGDVAKKGVDAVGDAVDSTSELVSNEVRIRRGPSFRVM
jgi:hypothetical protein